MENKEFKNLLKDTIEISVPKRVCYTSDGKIKERPSKIRVFKEVQYNKDTFKELVTTSINMDIISVTNGCARNLKDINLIYSVVKLDDDTYKRLCNRIKNSFTSLLEHEFNGKGCIDSNYWIDEIGLEIIDFSALYQWLEKKIKVYEKKALDKKLVQLTFDSGYTEDELKNIFDGLVSLKVCENTIRQKDAFVYNFSKKQISDKRIKWLHTIGKKSNMTSLRELISLMIDNKPVSKPIANKCFADIKGKPIQLNKPNNNRSSILSNPNEKALTLEKITGRKLAE